MRNARPDGPDGEGMTVINTVTELLGTMYRDDAVMLACLGTGGALTIVSAAAVAIGNAFDARRSSYWSRQARRAARRNRRH